MQAVLDHPEATLAAPAVPALPAPAPAEKPRPMPAALRSDAIALLATLQREARLVDLVQENLSQYSDAQIGAAARPCLQQCATTLNRLLGLRAIESANEGEAITVPPSASPARFVWIGEGSSTTGKLVHHGWEATHVDLPQWTGTEADAKVIAPVQVKRS